MRKGYSTCAFNASAQGKLMRITAPAWPVPSIRKPSLSGSNCALARPTVLPVPSPARTVLYVVSMGSYSTVLHIRAQGTAREGGGRAVRASERACSGLVPIWACREADWLGTGPA